MKKTYIIPSALTINLSPEGLVAGSDKIEFTSEQNASHDSEVLSNRRQSIWGSED